MDVDVTREAIPNTAFLQGVLQFLQDFVGHNLLSPDFEDVQNKGPVIASNTISTMF